ncbi:esterase-like activity of phytase family protein [Dactylosporangium siamense]|uniref:Glycerophosphoryl diester phosphodiesterase n=1 Tax=Dactylosporangium siamense TaxID=685454 RepID=A0A919PS11_9ACTN|nr:esterase-like activity of phytase family protein [Dactylosporangium siamense]GIG47405.1 glycerophosphoryl diester phosphodiesterase [Dactylosporangium siamense]
MRNLRRAGIGVGLGVLTLALAAPSASAHGSFGRATLTGFASLPAATFVSASDPSGSLLGGTPSNGITPPFADQPIQGFSGIVRNGDGTFEVLSDNGYGNKANSADFVLRIQRVAPDYGNHAVDVVGGINLTDPNSLVPFALTRPDRVLTGADFDVESIQRAKDGTYWIGDEFGPYLLHFDRAGRLLQAPIPLDGVRAPENPAGNPNLNSSKGFEGLAQSPDGRKLYALLEGVVAGDAAGGLRLNEFDIASRTYTGKRWIYQLEDPANAIGDAIAVDDDRFLIIERDNGQGATAKFKRIYLAKKKTNGTLEKTLVADLMDIADPRHLGGTSGTFTFPFQTIEDVVILDDRTLGVVNDNNFPFSNGRTPGQPDNNEFITIRLTDPLHADKRFLK